MSFIQVFRPRIRRFGRPRQNAIPDGMRIHEIWAIAADGSDMTQGSIRFEEDLRKKAKARFGFDRVGRNDRTIKKSRIRPGRIKTCEAEEILDSGFLWTSEDFAKGIVHPLFRQRRSIKIVNLKKKRKDREKAFTVFFYYGIIYIDREENIYGQSKIQIQRRTFERKMVLSRMLGLQSGRMRENLRIGRVGSDFGRLRDIGRRGMPIKKRKKSKIICTSQFKRHII